MTTGQCPWPSGLHAYRAGKCTRCGAIETPEPVPARTVSDADYWAHLAARTNVAAFEDLATDFVAPVSAQGRYARTGLGEGEDTRGESPTVPHGDPGEYPMPSGRYCQHGNRRALCPTCHPGENTARRFGPEFGHGNVTVR
jgi:hypothetical protein